MSIEVVLPSEKLKITRTKSAEISEKNLPFKFVPCKKILEKAKISPSNDQIPMKKVKPNQNEDEDFSDTNSQEIQPKPKFKPSINIFKKSNYKKGNEKKTASVKNDDRDEKSKELLQSNKIFWKPLDPKDSITWESFFGLNQFYQPTDQNIVSYISVKADFDNRNAEKKLENNDPTEIDNSRLAQIKDFYCDPVCNQPRFYNIVRLSRFIEFRSLLGDYYIGPANFIKVRNKLNANKIHISIVADKYSKNYAFPYDFAISEIIIPGIEFTNVEVDSNCEKTEISVKDFVYNENQVFFIYPAFDNNPYFSFSKFFCLRGPFDKDCKKIKKKIRDQILLKFPLCIDSLPDSLLLKIETDQDIERLIPIIYNEKPCFSFSFNTLMRDIDAQKLGNIILSYFALEKEEKEVQIFEFFKNENKPPDYLACNFVSCEIFHQLIKKIKSTKFSCNYAPFSELGIFGIAYYNLEMEISLLVSQTNSENIVEKFEKLIIAENPDLCNPALIRLNMAKLNFPLVTFEFNKTLFPKASASKNKIANLFRGYSYAAKKSDFIKENNWAVGEYYNENRNAPDRLQFKFTHSDVLIAFVGRVKKEAQHHGWRDDEHIGECEVTAKNFSLEKFMI